LETLHSSYPDTSYQSFTQKIKQILLLSGLSFLIGFATFDLQAQQIVYPWRATTAIVKTGDSFEIWLNAPEGQKVTSVIVQSDYVSIQPKFAVETANWEYDSTSHNTFTTKIRVTIPKKTPADRYTIHLNTNKGRVSSPAAVKIITNYAKRYYVLHLSDIHAFQNGYPTTMAKLNTLIEVANIINPEIVFNTGDNLYRPTEERMQLLFEGNSTKNEKGLNALTAAQFTTVGNHDTDFDHVPENGYYTEKSKWWNQWWGLQTHQFSYDKAHYMILNNAWVGFDPSKQIEASAKWSQKKRNPKLFVAAAHIKDSELLALDQLVPLDLVLVGHNHHIAHENPRLFNAKKIEYIANSIRDHEAFNLYEITNKTGKITPIGGPTAQINFATVTKNEHEETVYQPELSLTYENPNDGKASFNTALLKNRFPFPIHAARIRFVMPLGHRYTITNGQIVQAFDGDSFHIVDVAMDLPEQSNLSCTIQLK
jgi:predicted MPP superfamily phosphohydrolase